tara:strand:- start:11647 stop:11868 length:222 start_codon:yes stop_codon:yes gene_type:complete
MFTDMDKIDENKIMMNTMNYNDNIEDHDEVIVLQPNQINYEVRENNVPGINFVEKLLILALLLFGRHYLNVQF